MDGIPSVWHAQIFVLPLTWPGEMKLKKRTIAAVAAAGTFWSTVAFADQPKPWQMRFQPAVTPIMEEIAWFEAYTLSFIIPISIFVLALLGWCIVRFRESANPTPSRTAHNTLIEVVWTLGPVLILLAIAVPSFQLLTAQFTPPEEAGLTIKATGNQWNWDYEYQVGEEPVSFNAAILTDADRSALGKEDKATYPRLLATDNDVVVPVNTTVRVLVTASDVIHSFAVPSFGIKVDGVPGRINETWFKATKEGLYFGQCSELCGKDHAYMPIAVRVVSAEQYESWYAAAQADLDAANKALMASIESKNKLAATSE